MRISGSLGKHFRNAPWEVIWRALEYGHDTRHSNSLVVVGDFE